MFAKICAACIVLALPVTGSETISISTDSDSKSTRGPVVRKVPVAPRVVRRVVVPAGGLGDHGATKQTAPPAVVRRVVDASVVRDFADLEPHPSLYIFGWGAVSPTSCHWEQKEDPRSTALAAWVDADSFDAHIPYGKCRRENRSTDFIWTGCANNDVYASSKMTQASFCSTMLALNWTGVLFVGDSMSRTHAVTFAGMVGATRTNSSVPHRWLACADNSVRITFLENHVLDTLVSETGEPFPCEDDEICEVWADKNILSHYNVLVFNSGAHFLTPDKYANYMQQAVDSLQKLVHRDALLVWRDTVPGHSACDAATGPFSTIGEAQDDMKGNPWYQALSFEGHNRLAQDIFAKHPNYYMLPVALPTALRRDMHVGGGDCLHYCIPGPTMLWSDMLFHAIANHAMSKNGNPTELAASGRSA